MVLDLLFPVLTSDHSKRARERELEGGDGAGEGGATAAAATSALAAATAASRCKESCAKERAMAKSRGQTCYERKKDLGGKERGTEDGREGRNLPRKSEGETTDLVQKRANVDKIGGGSLQLLAGMSGNAWDSILKARPRQNLRATFAPTLDSNSIGGLGGLILRLRDDGHGKVWQNSISSPVKM